MSLSEQEISDLMSRLRALEDERAVHNVMVKYGFAVDAGDAEAAMSLFTEDTVYEVGSVGSGLNDGRTGSLIMKGRDAVGDMVLGDGHQSLLPNCAHTIGPFTVEVDGDKAHAIGYSRIYHRQGDETRLFRLGMNEWHLVRQDGKWLIHRRLSQVIGEKAGQEVLARAFTS